MRAGPIVISHVTEQQVTEVALAEHNNVVKARLSSPDHVLGHAGLSDIDAELEQLSMNPRRSPQRIGNAYLADPLGYLRQTDGPADLPPRAFDFHRQYNRNPARCHLTTVSGLTIASVSRTPGRSR